MKVLKMNTKRKNALVICMFGVIFITMVTSNMAQASRATSSQIMIQDKFLNERSDSCQDQSEETEIATSDPSAHPCPIDVFILIDLTASFAGEVTALRNAAPTIISTIQASYPNTRFGLGGFQDYAYSPYGISPDKPYLRVVDLTFDAQTLSDGLLSLVIGNGGDEPESQLPALYQTATGAGDGTWIPQNQQANFRSSATKIIVLITDASFHRFYDSIPGANPPSFAQTAIAIQALGFSKVVGLSSGENSLTDLRDIAEDTGGLAPARGVDCDNDGDSDILVNAPLVCTIGTQGEGLDQALIALVRAAAECRNYLPIIHRNSD
jgi:hypothetical protein